MPLIDPPSGNASWAQIQAGLRAAGKEQADQGAIIAAENVKLRTAKKAVNDAEAATKAADANYNAWIAKVRRLVFRPTV